MVRLGFACVCALGVVLCVSGCDKIAEPLSFKSAFVKTPLAMTDAVPAEYGTLVGVLPGTAPGWVSMWFSKPDHSIVVVYVNSEKGYFGPDALLIPRR